MAFVLIPGAGIDPRIYGATIESLRGLGHDAIAPRLPLDDAQATPSDHADAVAAAVPRDTELVVVAQSLGAFAGPLVTTRVPVAQLILLAPMIPKPGETAGEWWANTGHEQAIAALIERRGPMRSWDAEAMAEVFLHDVDAAVIRDSEQWNGAPGEGMFGEPWPLEAWPDVPTRVLAPREDRLFPLEFQRRVARERLGLEVDEMDGGHVPMLSRPDQLARRLVELSAAA
jgi:pimeloyl-ACP methyl ester carboxylesterase